MHSGPKIPQSLGATGAPLLGTAGSAHETAGGRWADGCRSHADWGPGLAREGAARDEKTKGPFLGRRRISRPDACSAVAMCWRGRHAVLASQVQRTIVSIHHFSTFA